MIFQDRQNAINFDKSRYSNWCFSKTTDLITSEKSRNRHVSTSGVFLIDKTIDSAPDRWTKKTRIVYKMVSIWFRNFLQTNLLDFFFQSPNLKLFTCVGMFRETSFVFFSVQ